MFFFALACGRIFIETHSIESGCYRIRKHTVWGCFSASFSPEMLQAVAVKGLREQQHCLQFFSLYRPPPNRKNNLLNEVS